MNAEQPLPTPRGIWAVLWSLLVHPLTPIISVVLIAGVATIGRDAAPGEHPSAGVVFRLLWCLVALCFAARAVLAVNRIRSVGLVAMALGLFTLGWAQWKTAQDTGRIQLSQRVTESYDRYEVSTMVPVHLRVQLRSRHSDVSSTLELGMRETVSAGPITLNHRGGQEESLGPYRLYVSEARPLETTEDAVLGVRLRTGGETREVRLSPGENIALDKTTQLRVLEIRRDYAAALGSAARIQLTWPEGVDTFWVYADAPGLDERVGHGPWAVDLKALRPVRGVELGVRRAATDSLVWISLGMLACGLIIFGSARRGVAS